MTAFFFGETGRQLFGYYHAAPAGATAAAVLCPSWGPEYQYAHRALRVLGRRLAERGTHVLRFDYAGTGDSWGDASALTPEQWIDDAALATAELRAMSGATRIDMVGLRYGAHVAARVAAGRTDLRRIVLWDPVFDGDRWLDDLSDSPDAVARARKHRGRPLEFSHRVVSPEIFEHFSSLSRADYPDEPAKELLVLSTTAEGDAHPLPHLSSAEFRHVPDAAPWVEDTSIWSGLVPARAIAAITEWVTS